MPGTAELVLGDAVQLVLNSALLASVIGFFPRTDPRRLKDLVYLLQLYGI